MAAIIFCSAISQKTRKYAITISLLRLKSFLAEPMESGTYLDDHILLYCVYRHESHMVVIVNSTMVGDALECFRTAFPLEI